MSSSKLLCTMVWGATIWGFVVILLATSRLNINLQFSRDLKADCHLEIDRPLERMARESKTASELPAHVDKYARQVFAGVQSKGPGSLDSMCTMVMLTYNREKILKFLLNHYCKVRSLHKIIVIWNNVNKSIPDDILEIKETCGSPDLLFIREKENKLTNRFKPRPEIETNCVCIMDDDLFIIDLRDLEFGFSVWQNFRHRIVGFEHRTHFLLENGSYWYDLSDFSQPRRNYSMILTSTAILHKAYLQMFFDEHVLPKGMIQYIDKRKNCEDIAMNVMVARFLFDMGQRQAAALAVRPRREVRNMEHSNKTKTNSNYTGLSSLPDHYIERSRCLDDFRDMYGGELILPHATFIMESLMKIPRRNRTYISRYRSLTRNASRSYFIRMHNITKSSINISDQQRTYGSFIAQRKQSYSHSNPQLRINNMTHSYMYHNVMLKSQKSRSYKNITVMQQRYYNAHQEAKHLRYFNATQLQTSYKQSYQQPSKGEQWRSFNGTQFWRQNNKPHLELKLKGGHGNNPVNKNSIR